MDNLLKKTHKKSFFQRYPIGGPLDERLNRHNPYLSTNGMRIPVVILQLLFIPESKTMMAELVWEKDYEEE
jgi:hypothetical protein